MSNKKIVSLCSMLLFSTILNSVDFNDPLQKKDLVQECKKENIFNCAFTINYNTNIDHNVFAEYSESKFTAQIPSRNIYSPGIRVKTMLPNLLSEAKTLKKKNNNISLEMTKSIEAKHLLLFALKSKIFQQKKFSHLLALELDEVSLLSKSSFAQQTLKINHIKKSFAKKNSIGVSRLITNTYTER